MESITDVFQEILEYVVIGLTIYLAANLLYDLCLFVIDKYNW